MSVDSLLVLVVIAAGVSVAVERLGARAFRLALHGRDNEALGMMALAAGLTVALAGLTLLALLDAGFGLQRAAQGPSLGRRQLGNAATTRPQTGETPSRTEAPNRPAGGPRACREH